MDDPRATIFEGWLERHERDTENELSRVRDKIVDLSQRIQHVTTATEQMSELRETVINLRVEMAALRTRVATVGAVLAVSLPAMTTLLIKLLRL